MAYAWRYFQVGLWIRKHKEHDKNYRIWPKWLTPKSISNPSVVSSLFPVKTAALLTKMSRRLSSATTESWHRLAGRQSPWQCLWMNKLCSMSSDRMSHVCAITVWHPLIIHGETNSAYLTANEKLNSRYTNLVKISHYSCQFGFKQFCCSRLLMLI